MFRVQVQDINIEPTPHQLRVSQVELGVRIDFIIIDFSDEFHHEIRIFVCYKLSDCLRHLIFWSACYKVLITLIENFTSIQRVHQTFYSKMWLYISVLGQVEHTSLVHGQTKVINKLVHQFIFLHFFIQEMLEITWNGRNLSEALGKAMFANQLILICPEAVGDESVGPRAALWAAPPPRTTSVSAPAPSLSGTSQLRAQTSAGVTSAGRRIAEVGGGGAGSDGKHYWLLHWWAGESDEPVNSEVDTARLSNTKYPPTASVSSGSPSSGSVKSSSSLVSYKQPYFGWRSQERAKLTSSYLTSPSQRLASSVLSTSRLQRIAE